MRPPRPMLPFARVLHLLGMWACVGAGVLATGCKDVRFAAEQASTQSAPDEALETPAFGATQPKIEVLAFVDFACPWSRQQALALAGLVQQHKDDVRVRVLHLPMAVHPDALLLARAAVAADDQRTFADFWQRWMRPDAAPTKDALIAWAVEAGLDARRFAHALTAPETLSRVSRDVAIAGALGVRGTPTLLVNGRMLTGNQSLDALEQAVQTELAASAALLAAGARHSGLVAARVRVNLGPRAELWERHVARAEPAPTQPVPVPSARAELQPVPMAQAPARAIALGSATTPTGDSAPAESLWRVTVRPDDPSLGATTAPVTVVVFADLESADFAQLWPLVRARADAHPESVRVVLKHLPRPVHPGSQLMAEALDTARSQQKWLAFLEALRARLSAVPLGQPTDAPALVEDAAAAAGVDRAIWRTAMAAQAGQARVQADVAQATDLGVDGFAAVFVNGRRLMRMDADTLDAALQAEATRAQQLIASGTPAAQVYDTTIKEGRLLDSLSPTASPLQVPRIAFDGLPGAPVELVVFGDFQCPYTARLWPHLQTLMAELPGRFRVAWLDFPQPAIHPVAQLAAEAAHEARAQNKFWTFRKALAQRADALVENDLLWAARWSGMDVRRLQRALRKHTWAAAVAADKRQGLAAGVRETPALFLDGHRFMPTGGISAQTLRPAIERLQATH